MTAHANWRDDAACRDADPDPFFPTGTTGPARRQIGKAKQVCRTCPAQTQCLAWALDNRVVRTIPCTVRVGLLPEGPRRVNSNSSDQRQAAATGGGR